MKYMEPYVPFMQPKQSSILHHSNDHVFLFNQ